MSPRTSLVKYDSKSFEAMTAITETYNTAVNKFRQMVSEHFHGGGGGGRSLFEVVAAPFLPS